MRRIENNTVTAYNILAAQDQLDLLLECLRNIEFVMSEEEQHGIYSLRRHLEWEVVHRCDAQDIVQPRLSSSRRLQELLRNIRRDEENGDHNG